MDQLTGQQFEHWCAGMSRRSGLRSVRVVGGSGDRGADIIARTGDGRKVVVQCKRWTRPVGDPHIQMFNGTVWDIHGADIAVLITTSWPTKPARELAGQLGITLLDRDALAAWAANGVVPLAKADFRGGGETAFQPRLPRRVPRPRSTRSQHRLRRRLSHRR